MSSGPQRGLFPGAIRLIVSTVVLGAVLFLAAGAVAWPAAWGYLAIVIALVLVLRTALEDRTLQAELDGYAQYARKVRFRLVPGLW